jgi:hypothetical protein
MVYEEITIGAIEAAKGAYGDYFKVIATDKRKMNCNATICNGLSVGDVVQADVQENDKGYLSIKGIGGVMKATPKMAAATATNTQKGYNISGAKDILVALINQPKLTSLEQSDYDALVRLSVQLMKDVCAGFD